MKKTLLLLATVLCCVTTIFAQNNKISYQAVVRDTANRLVANKSVEVTVNIYNGTATTAAYIETQTVTTNLNGLISLMIGPDVATPAWNSIQWNQARIETAVTLDNTSLGTLKMPLTAVPYAKYADYAEELNPESGVVQDLKAKILADSNALAGHLNDTLAYYYTKTETNTLLGAKADTGNVYTRTIINDKLGAKVDTASLAKVAKTGSYNDLSNKPDINNATLTIKQGETTLGSFTANASQDVEITIPPAQIQSDWSQTITTAPDFIKSKPTDLGQFTNNPGYLTCDSSCITNLTNLVGQLQQQLENLQQQISQSFPTPTGVTTATVTSIGTTSATSGGSVSNNNPIAVTERGICWGTSQNPDILGSHKAAETAGTGDFTVNFDGLTAGTTYYVRAYATNIAGTSYGENVTFTTLDVPTVTTTDATNVTGTSATSGGNVTADGGSTVTARGVKWGTERNNLSNEVAAAQAGTGEFSVDITGLTKGTQYYVCAYATNNAGTAYGDTMNFTTLNTPTVTTTAVTNVTTTGATSGGNVTADGGADVTARGVCWSTTENPTIEGNHTNDDTGTGDFTSSITELNCRTKYYVRAYATNAMGTSYGTQVTFTTDSVAPTVGTVAPTDVTTNGATLKGMVEDDGCAADVTARGFYWGTSETNLENHAPATTGGTGEFNVTITGLTASTMYYLCAYATNSKGTAYGDTVSFTTAWDGDLSNIPTSILNNNTVTVTNGMTITGTLNQNYKIVIAAGDTVMLNDVTINGEGSSYTWAGISCEGDATIILKDGSTNNVKGFNGYYPGIQPGPTGSTLTIQGETAGTGSLTASSNSYGAGIGGGNGISCGNINIKGGIITATGGQNAAGIGSGDGSSCGAITISGGTVTANGGGSAAGIGCGNEAICGDITITTGVTKVTVKKGVNSPNSIGRGYGNSTCGTVTIGGFTGVITQSPYTYPSPFANVTAEDVGKVIGADGNIYDNVTAATNANTTAVAIIAYVGTVGSVETGTTYKGLAIALSDANGGYICKWAETEVSCLSSSQTSDITTALGYKNGITCTSTLTGDSHTHAAATAAASNNNTAAPAGTSGWFLPSVGQWNLIVQGLATKKTGSAVTTDLAHAANDAYKAANLNSVITDAGGEVFVSYADYWASTEKSAASAWYISFLNGYASYGSKNSTCYVRSVIAF